MTLDGGIHHLGTEFGHLVPALMVMATGIALDSSLINGIAIGMFAVLLVGNMRCRAPFYRWRVIPADSSETTQETDQ